MSNRHPDAGHVPEPAAEPSTAGSATLDRPIRELGELTRALLTATTVDGVLQRVMVAARYLIPGADLVSITLRMENGEFYTPAGTDAEAIELDRVQYDSGQGPCLDAADPEGPAYAHSGDLAVESAWPDFARAAAGHGFASILSTALITVPDPVPFTGALNIYSRERGDLDVSARDTAFILATYASLALNSAQRTSAAAGALSDAEAEAANLRKALDTRTVIGQATGILMARRRLSSDDAFGLLARASQNHNVKLAHLAELLAQHPDTADRI